MTSRTFAHIVAILGSLFLSPILPLLPYLRLIDEANDLGGPLNLILIPCLNLLAGIVISIIMFVTMRLIRGNDTYYFGWSTLLFIGTFVGVVILNRTAIEQVDLNDQLFRFSALGGSGLLIAAPTYWLLYEMAAYFAD